MIYENLFEVFENTKQETIKQEKENLKIWNEIHNDCIDLTKYFIQKFKKERKDFRDELSGFRMVQLATKEMFIIQYMISSGLYENAIRNLRYILEAFLQAYYIDREYSEVKIECKFEVLKEMNKRKLIGNRLIEELYISKEYKKHIKSLYSELCAFIHPSIEEWEEMIKKGEIEPKVTIYYDKNFFERCLKYTIKMVDVIYFLLVNLYGEIPNNIRKNLAHYISSKEIDNSITLRYSRCKKC